MTSNICGNAQMSVTLQNNVKMPILGLGTSHNGGYSHDAIVHALRNCGYRHIDTAKRYGCEAYISEAIKESGVSREDIFLATKCWPTDYGSQSIKEAFHLSQQRLDTDYIDLYMLHWPEVPSGRAEKELLQETWRSLEMCYDEDLVKCIGVSNFLEKHLNILLEDCSVVPHVNQCEFHPYNNPVDLRKMCSDCSIQFEGYCPLANGSIFNEPLIHNIALRLEKSVAQVVLRWNIQQNIVCIPKSTNMSRVSENSQIFDFDLSSSDMEILSNLPQNLTVIDRSEIQYKIDNPIPDGHKLNFITCPPSMQT